MIDSYRINSLFDADVVDTDGSKIGTVKHVYVDPDGGQPLFVGVTTGWFGRSESFVPLRDAEFDGELLHVEYDKDVVKHAPRIDADGTLTDDDIDRIHDYYDGGGKDDSGDDDSGDDHSGDDDSGDDDARRRADDRVTSREDPLTGDPVVVHDQRPPRERIRIHRYVVADERTGTTPLSHDDPLSNRDATSDPAQHVDQGGYETVEESRVDRLDESRRRAADDSSDLGAGQLRRRPE